MRVEVFDDWPSVAHFVLGLLPFNPPLLFTAFLAYELVEFMLLYRKKEGVKDFIGDLLEYALGRCFGSIVFSLIC